MLLLLNESLLYYFCGSGKQFLVFFVPSRCIISFVGGRDLYPFFDEHTIKYLLLFD
jgi:hypothetical protein